jgi:hypothetical protein
MAFSHQACRQITAPPAARGKNTYRQGVSTPALRDIVGCQIALWLIRRKLTPTQTDSLGGGHPENPGQTEEKYYKVLRNFWEDEPHAAQ